MDRLSEARARQELLSAYVIAFDHLLDVIECCRAAESDLDDESGGVDDARVRLVRQFGFTDVQADAVLTLQLRRLTPAQIERVRNELARVEDDIARLS